MEDNYSSALWCHIVTISALRGLLICLNIHTQDSLNVKIMVIGHLYFF